MFSYFPHKNNHNTTNRNGAPQEVIARKSCQRHEGFAKGRAELATVPFLLCIRNVRNSQRYGWNRYQHVRTKTWRRLTSSFQGWDEGSAASITSLASFAREYQIDDSTISNIVSLVNVGAGVGAFLSFFLNDRIGRIWSMRLYQSTYAVGSLISCFSYGNQGALYVGRIVAGLGIGACTVVGPMSIAELAPKDIRGLLTLWLNVCMLASQALGSFTVLGCSQNISPALNLQYQVPWFVQTFVPAISIVCSFFICESPRWLAINGRMEDARATLYLLRGLPENDVSLQLEYAQLATHLENENETNPQDGYWAIIKETFSKRSNLRRVQLTIVAYILAQFSGANSITNYLPTIFGYIGVQGTSAKIYSTGLYAVAKLVFCFAASLFIVDVLGRRKSLMLGVSVQMLCHAYLAGYLKHFIEDPSSMPSAASDVAIAVIYIHAFGWAVGLYTLPYLFGAELWPNRIRSFGGALSQCFHWLFYFAITKATPSILNSMAIWGAFVFFLAWCVVAFVYTLFLVPETRGLSLDEMDALFERPMYMMRHPLVLGGDEESFRQEKNQMQAKSGHFEGK
ncbi:Quinate permease [Paramyrothecium foliicola]|nr:Quinate permease [Paramyrothecium foliicola]